MSHKKNVAEAPIVNVPLDENAKNEILLGLLQSQKKIHPKFLYDSRGSDLFEQICDLPEYYPTRTETLILQKYSDEIGDIIGPGSLLVEFGAGASIKTRVLLQSLAEPLAYVPIDISKEFLLSSVQKLRSEFPKLHIHSVPADYTVPILIPSDLSLRANKKVGFFPGSTFGNFEQEDARDFLKNTAKLLGPNNLFLIGVDLIKDQNRLESAYNDSRGVTAAFNLNILLRMNKELQANFKPSSFSHHALFNPVIKRIEMHLVSQEDQIVNVAGTQIPFRKGETIHTESSYKFNPKEFENFVETVGFSKLKLWTDPEELFAVYLLEVKAREF